MRTHFGVSLPDSFAATDLVAGQEGCRIECGRVVPSGNGSVFGHIRALNIALQERDEPTHDHCDRVEALAVALGQHVGLTEHELQCLRLTARLHDIGKIGIPDAILLKPGPLTPAEWKIMRSHPEIGRRLVEKIPFLRGAVPIVYHHHERWDGTGYPLGLRGAAIPLGARIFAIADALDAMTFDRPYSRAISFETARDEITRCAGTHFDPAIVETFLTIPLQTFASIRHESLQAMGADPATEAFRAALDASRPTLEGFAQL